MYPDIATTLKRWARQGVFVWATTLDKDHLERSFYILEELDKLGVEYEETVLTARCCGTDWEDRMCRQPATLTTRTTPIGDSMVGDVVTNLAQ